MVFRSPSRHPSTVPPTLVRAIDVHAHYGEYRCAAYTELRNTFASGSLQTVLERARRADIELSFVSPIEAVQGPKADPVGANRRAMAEVAKIPEVRLYAVVDPTQPETFAQAHGMLGHPCCVGIKIHPEDHGYPISEHAEAIFAFAAEHHAVLQTHSGEKNSLPADFVPWANRFPEVALILAHLGHGWDHDQSHQVRAIQASRHGNVYVDTSSAQNIAPGLLEWAVREIGAERILFGTDTPSYFVPMQRVRVEAAEMGDREKEWIFRCNAIRLFHLDFLKKE